MEVTVVDPVAAVWQTSDLPETTEGEWRSVLLREAVKRVTLRTRLQVLECLRGLPRDTVEEIDELVLGITIEAMNIMWPLSESLRHVHATPETSDPADVEERLQEAVQEAVGLVEPDRVTILDPAGYLDCWQRFKTLYGELMRRDSSGEPSR